ncbi:SulP family inorganic anion transporter [Chitinibacteraceae bacterium HSL-7]
MSTSIHPRPLWRQWLVRLAPGLSDLRHYPRHWLRADVGAGLSVTAVAIPVGIAYAQLAGLPPAAGLYATILPMVIYALVGSSRQLILGPDAATCALLAAALAPLAAAGSPEYGVYAIELTVLTGVFCLIASRLKLGVLADFLSLPILTGFLNGIGIYIIIGQLGKVLGIEVASSHSLDKIWQLGLRLDSAHIATAAVALLSFLVMLGAQRWMPKIPAALAVMVVAGAGVAAFGLDQQGVAIVGDVPAGLPHLLWVPLTFDVVAKLAGAAAGITLLSFSSMMLTARSFAARNGYEVDADRDFAALGAANISAGILGGFCISGGDSRTAVNDAAGGKTRAVGLIAALALVLALMFLTPVLRYLPHAALGVVLMFAGWSLLDTAKLGHIRRASRREWLLALFVSGGVLTIGVIDAITLAIALALVRFLKITARPRMEELGTVPHLPGLHSMERHVDAHPHDGMMLLRFNGPLVFFNAPYFKQEIFDRIGHHVDAPQWLVLDLLPVSLIDVTGYATLAEVVSKLEKRGIAVKLAGRKHELGPLLRNNGVDAGWLETNHYPTLRTAMRAFDRARRGDSASTPEPADAE